MTQVDVIFLSAILWNVNEKEQKKRMKDANTPELIVRTGIHIYLNSRLKIVNKDVIIR